MLKFNLGNPDPWHDGCSAYNSGLTVNPNGDASERLEKKQIGFRAQCRAPWHDSSTSISGWQV